MFGRRTHEAKAYEVAGHRLTCPICGQARFTPRRVLLNTRLLTFLDVEWADRQATAFVCTSRGHILWFIPT